MSWSGQASPLLLYPFMRNRPYTNKPQHDHEAMEEEQANLQPMRLRTDEEDEEELAHALLEEVPDDMEDHSMERLDDDDLANMQGPDA